MERACIMINHYYYTCIVPTLMDFLLGYVTHIHYDVVSRELHHVVVQMVAPARSETFLLMFVTPALLWRVLHYVGIMNRPSITGMKYTWRDNHGMKYS